MRSVVVWCWLRAGRVLALMVRSAAARPLCERVLALFVLLSGRRVVVGADAVVERVEERERFDLGCIDALADNER